MKRKTVIIISSITAAILLAIGGIVLFIAINRDDIPFRLDDEYYTSSEAVTIEKDEYEKLMKDEKSFLVMVDKPGCVTTAEMRDNMSAFPTDMQFKYYRMMWNDVKESSLHEYIKFAPSVAIIRKGEVKAWLQADKDEDGEYFNSAEALQRWIRKYIIF